MYNHKNYVCASTVSYVNKLPRATNFQRKQKHSAISTSSAEQAKRDRLAALALRPRQTRIHLPNTRENGKTKEEPISHVTLNTLSLSLGSLLFTRVQFDKCGGKYKK